MQAVILAGGLATRLHPFSERIPKSLIPIAGRPFIDYQLALLKANGVDEVVICAGHLGNRIVEYVGDGSFYGLDVPYSFDGDRPAGTCGALKLATDLLEENFVVVYGDSYLPIEYEALALAHAGSGRLGMMAVHKNADRYDRSNVAVEGGRVISYEKNAPLGSLVHIDAGALGLSKPALDLVEDGPRDLSELMAALIDKGQLEAYIVDSRFYEIGSFEGLAEFTALVEQGAVMAA